MTTTQNSTKTNTDITEAGQVEQYEVGTIVHVAPESLLMTKNIRDAKPSPALVKSVAEVGILQPIVTVITTNSQGAPALLVRFGHRRTLAAIEAKTTAPVYIAGVDGEAKTDEILRVIAQRDENTHRDGLTTADELTVVETLTGLGLSAAQITKQARMKRTDVDAALAVSESKLARGASQRYEALTLDQLAVVAEFEDDTDTVKTLIAAASTGQFDHVAQRVRTDREKARAQAEMTESLTATGARVIDRPPYGSPVKPLGDLKADTKATETLTPETHAECPGHVAWIAWDWQRVDKQGQPIIEPDEPGPDATEAEWEAYEAECDKTTAASRSVQVPVAVYGCEDPTKHGHVDRYGSSGSSPKPKAAEMSEAEREAAKKARALVIENNRAWEAAETVRREWLSEFAKRKTPPKGTGAFLATALCRDAHAVNNTGGNALAADWLANTKHTGYGRVDLSPARTATENRALVTALVQVLGGYEASLTRDSWRHNGTNNSTGRYLRFLQDCGYNLSDVERFAISKTTA